MEIVKKFLKGVDIHFVIAFVRQYGLGSLKNPASKGYKAAKEELVGLAKDVQEKWPDEFE